MKATKKLNRMLQQHTIDMLVHAIKSTAVLANSSKISKVTLKLAILQYIKEENPAEKPCKYETYHPVQVKILEEMVAKEAINQLKGIK